MTYFKLKTILLSLTLCFWVDAVSENLKNLEHIGYLYDKPINTLENAAEINKGTEVTESHLWKPSMEYLHPKVHLSEIDGEILEAEAKLTKEDGQQHDINSNGTKIKTEKSSTCLPKSGKRIQHFIYNSSVNSLAESRAFTFHPRAHPEYVYRPPVISNTSHSLCCRALPGVTRLHPSPEKVFLETPAGTPSPFICATDRPHLEMATKRQIFLYVLLLWGSTATHATAEDENVSGNQSTTEASKSEITKREDPEAQRRDHSFNSDGTVNYHGSGSGHDSGDLVPPPGGSVFNSPSIELSVGQTGASGPGLSNSYGLPIPDDTYGPPKHFFNDKPSGFYASPPPQQYGPPNNNKYLPAPPKPVYGPPKPSYRPPSPPKPVYGAPSLSQFRPPKTSYTPVKPIRSKPSFGSRPKPVYGPPKDGFGGGFSHGTLLSPVTGVKSQYGPPKISATYGTPLQPSTSYGVPKHTKHGHGSAPPTPPIVKYDGWKPIPGLVSNAPSSAYGAPDSSGHGISTGHGVDFSSAAQISGGGFDGLSPPSGSYGAPSFGGSSFGSSGFGISLHSGSGGVSFGGSKPSFSYGTPLQPSTSYGPPSHKGSSKVNFLSAIKPPSPSYGFPEPSVVPHPPKPSHSYGPPKSPSSSYGPPKISSSYGPPKAPSISYGPPKAPSISYGPPKAPSISYGPPKPPSSSYGPPKPPSISYGPPKSPSSSYGPPKALSSSYGPPSISFGSFGPPTGISSSFTPPKIPSSAYGPPKSPSSSYGPPNPPSISYGVPKAPSSSYGPPKAPSNSYGPPKAPSSSYGPPKAPSSSYGPPKAPSTAYGPPKPPSSSYGPPQIFTTYSIPKPGFSVGATPSTAYRGPSVPHPLQPPSTYGPPSFQGGLYKTPLPPNALYGVPTAPVSGVGCCGSTDSSFQFQSDTYGAPLPDLHAPAVQSVPSIEINSQFLSTGPSPVFPNAIPSTSYGTPILASTPATVHHSPSGAYGVPTALPLRQPKNPVKFRPPVPAGLISSIGAKWGDSAAWGGSSQSQKFHANTYIPPAVPDPDPGIHANKGNALVIPPPSAPPINYGPPQGNEGHGHASNQFASAVTSHSSGEGSLYPPPPPPPVHGQGSFDIQQSASVELPASNNLDHHGSLHDNNNQFSAGSATSYNAPIDTGVHHQPSAPSAGQDFSGGVQNIPIKGSQGSYTLQIQAAGGNSGEHVPHNEVLSNGLLQDILAAIENPAASGKLEQYGGQQPSDPVASEIGLNILKQLGGGTDAQQSNGVQLPSQYGSDLSHSPSSNVPSFSQNSETGNEVVQIPSTSVNVTEGGASDVKIGNYLSQNKIAFYYKNQEGIEERKGDGKDIVLVQMLLPNNSTSSESEKRPVRTNRLETSTVRAAPYPQPTVYNQTQTVVPDSTVQEAEPAATADCHIQSSKPAEHPLVPADHCHAFVQGKIGPPNVGHSCAQNSTTAPYNTTATIPVIQPSCVLPVEQCIGNGVLTNISSNGNCIPASPCFTTVIPANIVGTNSNACLPVTPRFQTPVVDSSVAITDCRCQAEGGNCCHSAIASYSSPHAPASMIFVPYAIPNFPPQPRGNLASNTSPCGGATPVKDAKGSRATSPRAQSKPDTSQHFHIFVGDLSPEIDTQTLRDAFAPFGEISDSRVVRDAQTLKSKGYGFVSFIKKSEAKSAIAAMNGRWLGSRSIRTNWATRKPPILKADGNPLPLSFDEVYKQSSASNCTVYCGGIINGLTEELVQKIFSPFGTIQEIKVFKDKGYAFVRFSTKESAAHAIVAVHNTDVNGQVVKCSWGKENTDLTSVQATAQFDQPMAGATFPYTYGQQMGYWYPQSFPATTTQIPGQYLQSGFSLGQFGYHQDFIGRLSMNLSSIWNGIPGQTQLPTTMQPIGQGTAIQQPNSVVAAYPVQRFQLPEEEWTAPSLLV